jgi:hypothetical protein
VKNLIPTRDERMYLIGLRYNREKGIRGGPRGKDVCLRNVAKELADEYKEKDPKTILRYGTYAESVDAIRKKSGIDPRNKGFTFLTVKTMAERYK